MATGDREGGKDGRLEHCHGGVLGAFVVVAVCSSYFLCLRLKLPAGI